MAYGKIKTDTLVYDNNGSDVEVAISSIPSTNNTALTGTPTAPTAGTGTNTTQIATTAFVLANNGPGVDDENTWTKGQRGEITELAAGTSFTIDLDASNNFLIQPSGTYTVTLSNISGSKGQCGSIFIKPTAAAASGSFPTTMKFVGGAAGITLTGTSGSIDRIDYIVQDDSSGYECLTCNFTANYVA